MTVITVSGLADGSMAQRAGQAGTGCSWTGWSKNFYCSFCFQHAVSERPADEEGSGQMTSVFVPGMRRVPFHHGPRRSL